MTLVFDTVWAAAAALKAYGEGETTLSPELKQKIATITSQVSPVQILVEGVETLYANRTQLTDEGHEIAAAMASIGSEHGFSDFRTDDRATKIMMAHLRESGAERALGEWPTSENDPASKDHYKVGTVAEVDPTPPV